MFNKMTLNDIEVDGKTVLLREDFNVPIKDGKVTDDTRIVAALPTIEYLIEKGASVVVMSHLGRPGGEIIKEFSLNPVAEYLDGLIKSNVKFVDDCIGPKVNAAVADLEKSEILVLENTRFYPGEKANDPKFSKQLASIADIFVNDAFGTSHRAHASNVGVAKHLPSAAGFLIEKELEYLGNAINHPKRPFIAILGGAKVSGKIGVINNLIDKVESILIGGGMANTFFAAQGYKMGKSLVEEDVIELAGKLLEKAGSKLVLPIDMVIANRFADDAEQKVQPVSDIPDDWMVLDIGPETLDHFNQILKRSETIVWNGPMGVFELPNFSKGTFGLAELIAETNAVSIIGGGDSAAAVKAAGLESKITHISTGGGASLQMLEGSPLPGLEAIQNKE